MAVTVIMKHPRAPGTLSVVSWKNKGFYSYNPGNIKEKFLKKEAHNFPKQHPALLNSLWVLLALLFRHTLMCIVRFVIAFSMCTDQIDMRLIHSLESSAAQLTLWKLKYAELVFQYL